jgi:hypothetical protein
MLDEVLVLLKDQLHHYLSASRSSDQLREDPVVFVDGDKMDPLVFQLNTITVLLINVEEEKTLRPPDLYRRIGPDGISRQVQPEIRLNLYVLFVARFQQYETALQNLSLVLRYFQNHRLFRHPDTPGLNEEIDQLVVELVTLPFAEQNEVWNSLRVAYHPSLLYRVKMVVVQDEQAIAVGEIKEKELRFSQ